MNHQTQGPFRNEGVELIDVGDVPSVPHAVIRSEGERWVALVEIMDGECEANARLIPAALNAFDKAGRALGVDAAELAERIDLAALITALQAVNARINGEFDHPALAAHGPLGFYAEDCLAIVRKALAGLPEELSS
jgi:hypothetical protein